MGWHGILSVQPTQVSGWIRNHRMLNSELINKLFDLEWYRFETGDDFLSKQKALQHYLSIGEKSGFFPNPLFDPNYYYSHYQLDRNESALCDFCEAGVKENRSPNAYFLSEWYKWQNPDSESYEHPVLHYLSVGGREFRDPSPWVDMVLVKRAQDNSVSGVSLLNSVIKGQHISGVGICNSQKQLVAMQRKFFDDIDYHIVKEKSGGARRKYLLWVQCRLNAQFFNWYKNADRNWDLLINYYDSNQSAPDIGEYIVSQNGTKFTAIFNVWRYTNIFEAYDYILFIDDDLIFKYDSIDEYFNVIDKNSLGLSQPSLTKGSYGTWPVFFKQRSKGYRRTNGVEIMMPAFSRNCLGIMAPYFSLSVSGFGLDLLFARLAKENGLKAAVVDAVSATHNSVIDQNSGAYYELLRSYGINSKYELWSMIERFNLDKEFYQLR